MPKRRAKKELREVEAMSASEIRSLFAEVVSRVHYTNEPVVIERRRKPLAALISYEQFTLLQSLLDLAEDDLDAEAILSRANEKRVSLANALRGIE